MLFRSKENAYKNRYRDVVCLDDSRVKLKMDSIKEFETSRKSSSSHSSNSSNEESSQFDYIHANFVDGYKQKKAFINAQGPLDETIEDFWLMIWQEMTLVIAMTTKVIEQRRLKCAQYWPLEVGEVMKLENMFEIENTHVEDLNDYKVTSLTIRHLPVSWKDVHSLYRKSFNRKSFNRKSISLKNPSLILWNGFYMKQFSMKWFSMKWIFYESDFLRNPMHFGAFFAFCGTYAGGMKNGSKLKLYRFF